jgi:predicted permease
MFVPKTGVDGEDNTVNLMNFTVHQMFFLNHYDSDQKPQNKKRSVNVAPVLQPTFYAFLLYLSLQLYTVLFIYACCSSV